MADNLPETIRKMRVNAMIEQAATIRDHPACDARRTEAQKLITDALMQRTLGRITDAEKWQILNLLSFAFDLSYPAPDPNLAYPLEVRTETPEEQPAEPPPRLVQRELF